MLSRKKGFVNPCAAGDSDVVTDLPRWVQWTNCLTDILRNPAGYDSRESISVMPEKTEGKVSLVGKGFSWVTALVFAVIKGADCIENMDPDTEVQKAEQELELWQA